MRRFDTRFIYYSLANSSDPDREWQWIESIRSLRRCNADVPVWLFLFNGASPDLLDEARRQGVEVRYLGEYPAYLAQSHVRGSVLAVYPTFHKFLALTHGPTDTAAQILYVDCDTYFFGDPAQLFDLYSASEWYAREEPFTRRSPFGYDPGYVDEAALLQLAAMRGSLPVTPFNSGVCMLNHGIWHRIEDLRAHYLDLAWRLLCGKELDAGRCNDRDPEIAQKVLAAANHLDRGRALPYPSSNGWIVEQVALWLTLGSLPGFTQDFFSPEHVRQGSETTTFPLPATCIAAHYYSGCQGEFFAALNAARGRF